MKTYSCFKVDQVEMSKQIQEYSTLKLFQSYRKRAGIMLLIPLALVIVLTINGQYDLVKLAINSIMWTTLIVFVSLGHRWAMLLGIIIFSLNSGFIIINDTLKKVTDETYQRNWVVLTIAILAWFFFVRLLYRAYLVEKHRKT